MVFLHNQRLRLYQENTYREGFQINQDNTSVQKVGAFFTEILQELCSSSQKQKDVELEGTRLASVFSSALMEVMIHEFCLLQLLNHISAKILDEKHTCRFM
jgi:hypothetical protein